MRIDPSLVPLSRYGSRLSLTLEPDGSTVIVRNCRRWLGDERTLALTFARARGGSGPAATPAIGSGPAEAPEVAAEPSTMRVVLGDAAALLHFSGDEEVRVAARGLRVTLRPLAGWLFRAGPSVARLHAIQNHSSTTDIVTMRGSLEVDATTVLVDGYHRQRGAAVTVEPDADGEARIAIRIGDREEAWTPSPADDAAERAAAAADWERFRAALPEVGPARTPVAEQLWYNLWSSFVRAGGNLRHDAVLMSKNSMCAVWSWDHCFNALALAAGGLRRPAFEQFIIPFAMQGPSGKLPDLVNTEIEWRACVKPPVHGWCLDRLLDAGLPAGDVGAAYGPLAAWTDWHFACRDSDGDGIPEYVMGNDSGWDNATVFDRGAGVESPDLAAFLVLQMRTLARMARHLGRSAEAQGWTSRWRVLLERLLEHSWNGTTFVAPRSGTHDREEDPTSLLAAMPVVLGDLLPRDVMDALAARIERRHLTAHGVATESPASPRYRPDGYWRGPVWAPTTYLVVDGLRRGGHPALARTIADRFVATVAAAGSWENYDALTGRGLCDRGYTWTSSAALLLMHEYRD